MSRALNTVLDVSGIRACTQHIRMSLALTKIFVMYQNMHQIIFDFYLVLPHVLAK